MNDKFKISTIRLTKELWTKVQRAAHIVSLERGHNVTITAFIGETLTNAVEEVEKKHSTQST